MSYRGSALYPATYAGNPVQILIARFQGPLRPQATPSLAALFGLNHASLWSQYVKYWSEMVHGNLGISFTYFTVPVTQVIRQSLPWTVAFIGISTVIGFAIGTLLGIIAGWRRGSWTDSVLPITTFFSSVPYFWFALVAVFLLGAKLHWFPMTGGYSTSLSIALRGRLYPARSTRVFCRPLRS